MFCKVVTSPFLVVFSTTIPLPLSACLMIMSGFSFRSFSALLSWAVRLLNVFAEEFLFCFRYQCGVGVGWFPGGGRLEWVFWFVWVVSKEVPEPHGACKGFEVLC